RDGRWFQALKGRYTTAVRGMSRPFRAWELGLEPRASPWAMLSQPFGLKTVGSHCGRSDPKTSRTYTRGNMIRRPSSGRSPVGFAHPPQPDAQPPFPAAPNHVRHADHAT